MIIVIILIIITLIAVAIFSLRLFSIEKVELQLPDAAEDEAGEDSEDEEQDGEETGEDDGEPAEMVNVFDYFEEESGDSEQEQDVEKSNENYTKTDKLTDFSSGRKYIVECKKSLESAKDDGRIYCSVYFDFDRFSFINSLKGAATGDYVLTNTAQQLRRIFPEGAIITRVSCDHFAAVFPLVDLALFDDYYEQLRRMCEKIRNDIAAKTGLRICVGFATTDNDASYDVNVLIARANAARQSAKVTKSDKFETFDESMTSSHFFGASLMENYNECQYGDNFAIYFELMVDLIADNVFGCDTMVRWNFDEQNNEPITPDTGKIPTNNDKVIYHVCRAMSRWRKAAREVSLVFVDVPVTDLFKTDIDEFIRKCLTEFQIEPQILAVKIDVSSIRLDWSTCSKQFKKFRELGIKICVSGIDTGYSNFDFLAGLSIDYVKLHRSFVQACENNREQLEKCRRIIERVTSIGAKVIFEGVDNMEQVDSLRSINAKTIQGKYTGRPKTVDDLIRELPEHVERRSTSDQTIILDEAEFAKGDWNI